MDSTISAIRPKAVKKPTILRWEAPPPSRGYGHTSDAGNRAAERWRPVADELRANRGDWAVLYDGPLRGGPTALSRNIRVGALGVFSPAGDFDACNRTYGDRLVVHACYLGDDE